MKYVSLKNILEKFLICAVMCSPLSTVAANEMQTNTSNIKTTHATQAYNNEIEEAYEILLTFKKTITAFFDRNNNETYTQHVQNFAYIVDRIKNLSYKVGQEYNATNSEKHRQLLIILDEIEENVSEIYNVLTQKYKTVLTLALALGRIIKKYTDPAKLADLQNKLNNLKEQLNEEEEVVLAQFISTLDSIDENIPKSKIACLSRLNRVWKNQ